MVIEGKAQVPMDRGMLADAAANERYIKRLKDKDWVLAGDEEGAVIREEVLGATVCPYFIAD